MSLGLTSSFPVSFLTDAFAQKMQRDALPQKRPN